MKKAVVFDLDGVLADTEPLHREARDAILRVLGVEKRTLGQLSVGCSLRGFWGSVIEKNGLSCSAESLTKKNLSLVAELVEHRGLKPTEGLTDLLAYLTARKIVVSVASSSDRDYVARVLSALGISRYFSCFVGGDEVEHTKPSPEIYLKAVSLCNVPPCDAAAIEDSDTGMTSAKTAGLLCIGYDAPTAETGQTFAFCDRKISRLIDAVKIIEEE